MTKKEIDIFISNFTNEYNLQTTNLLILHCGTKLFIHKSTSFILINPTLWVSVIKLDRCVRAFKNYLFK